MDLKTAMHKEAGSKGQEHMLPADQDAGPLKKHLPEMSIGEVYNRDKKKA
jgi:hypothetical protein